MVKTIVKNHIRKMRFERNEMSQQKLADQIGVTRQTVNATGNCFLSIGR